ncbi:hypothetical protein [Kocuria aegyptia]|uniref:Uncharacterized protein n=1 Tax=Kocuria aegyptia TaxID=330943 RepID=A0ABN2K2J4_9MICC
MTVLAHKQAAAGLTVVHPDGPTTTRVFVDDSRQELDPFHRAEQRRDAMLAEHPMSTVTNGINERALDAATVTKRHAAGPTDWDLLDAEQTRQALEGRRGPVVSVMTEQAVVTRIVTRGDGSS